MQQLTPRVTTSLHLLLLKSYIISVARFREMSPLRQNFKSLRQIFESLFSIWQIFEPIWQILYAIGNICAVVNGQTLENSQLASGRSHCPLSLSLSLSLSSVLPLYLLPPKQKNLFLSIVLNPFLNVKWFKQHLLLLLQLTSPLEFFHHQSVSNFCLIFTIFCPRQKTWKSVFERK